MKFPTVSSNSYGMAVFLFLLFLATALSLKHGTWINVGVFCGLIYNQLASTRVYLYPWDVPAMLFFTLAILLYEQRRLGLMAAAICTGFFFKETVLVCAVLFLFVHTWHWKERAFAFLAVTLVCLLGKKDLVGALHLNTPMLSMNNAATISRLFDLSQLRMNINSLVTLQPNYVLLANGGALLGVLLLGWSRKYLPYKLVLLLFLAGQLMYGNYPELRIFGEVLPLSWILLFACTVSRDPAYAPMNSWSSQSAQEFENCESGVQQRSLSPDLRGSVLPLVRQRYKLIRGFLILTFTVIAAAVAVGAVQFYAIVHRNDPERTSRAIADLEARAARGVARAQLLLARRYLHGDGVEQSRAHALRWLGEAAQNGEPIAQCELGQALIDAKPPTVNYSDGLSWLRKSALQGNAEAQYTLGRLAEHGRAGGKDVAEAVIWYERAAQQGHVLAQLNLGTLLYAIRGEPSLGVTWLEKAAQQGSAPAQNRLGLLYAQGNGVERNRESARKWFREAADLGLPDAHYNLAQLLLQERKNRESVMELRVAAEQGQKDAQYLLGEMYREGQGLTPDLPQAYYWFKLAEASGHLDAGKEASRCVSAMTPEQLRATEQQLHEKRGT